MEKTLNLVVKLSLEEMALRRVVINLWNEADVIATIQNFRIFLFSRQTSRRKNNKKEIKKENKKKWRITVEEKVRAKVSSLRIPNSLKKRMVYLVTPIGFEILRWKFFYMKFDASAPVHLCWTSTGVVDYRKTVEKVVRLGTYDVADRYQLACSYCLEDYLPALWKELPKGKQKEFLLISDDFSVDLEVYWAYILKGDKYYFDSVVSEKLRSYRRHSSFNQYAFEFSARRRNKAAIEYFFKQLTNEERNSSLLKAASFALAKGLYYSYKPFEAHDKVSNVLSYLLSIMSCEQQMEALKKNPYEVLRHFLDWPWQDLLLNIAADIVWEFPPESDNRFLMKKIAIKIKDAGHYCPNFIHEFFRLITPEFRKHFVQSVCNFAPQLFLDVEDPEMIKLFFRNVDHENRAFLVLNSCFVRFLGDLINISSPMRRYDKWDLVKTFISEASLSKENKEELKAAFLNEFQQNYEADKMTLFFDIVEKTENSTPKK